MALPEEAERPTVALTGTESERPPVGRLDDTDLQPTADEEGPPSKDLDPFFFEG